MLCCCVVVLLCVVVRCCALLCVVVHCAMLCDVVGCCWLLLFRRLHHVCIHSTYTRNAARPIKSHAQPGDVGLRTPQKAQANSGPVLHRNISLITLMHTPCLGISMILNGMILNPQSLPNTWPRLNPQIPCLTRCAGVFLFKRLRLVGLF